MASAKVKIESIQQAIAICQNAITNFNGATATLKNQCQTAGTNWNDSKYQQVKNVVDAVCENLKQPTDKLAKCQENLRKLAEAIKDYEGINIQGGN